MKVKNKDNTTHEEGHYPENPPWTMFFDGPLYARYDEFMRNKDFSQILLTSKLHLANNPPVNTSDVGSTKDPNWWDEQPEVRPYPTEHIISSEIYNSVSDDFYKNYKEKEKKRTRRTRAFIVLSLAIIAALALGTALVIHYFFIPGDGEAKVNAVNISFTGNSSQLDNTTPDPLKATLPGIKTNDELTRLLGHLHNNQFRPRHRDKPIFSPDGKIFDGMTEAITEPTTRETPTDKDIAAVFEITNVLKDEPQTPTSTVSPLKKPTTTTSPITKARIRDKTTSETVTKLGGSSSDLLQSTIVPEVSKAVHVLEVKTPETILGTSSDESLTTTTVSSDVTTAASITKTANDVTTEDYDYVTQTYASTTPMDPLDFFAMDESTTLNNANDSIIEEFTTTTEFTINQPAAGTTVITVPTTEKTTNDAAQQTTFTEQSTESQTEPRTRSAQTSSITKTLPDTVKGTVINSTDITSTAVIREHIRTSSNSEAKSDKAQNTKTSPVVNPIQTRAQPDLTSSDVVTSIEDNATSQTMPAYAQMTSTSSSSVVDLTSSSVFQTKETTDPLSSTLARSTENSTVSPTTEMPTVAMTTSQTLHDVLNHTPSSPSTRTSTSSAQPTQTTDALTTENITVATTETSTAASTTERSTVDTDIKILTISTTTERPTVPTTTDTSTAATTTKMPTVATTTKMPTVATTTKTPTDATTTKTPTVATTTETSTAATTTETSTAATTTETSTAATTTERSTVATTTETSTAATTTETSTAATTTERSTVATTTETSTAATTTETSTAATTTETTTAATTTETTTAATTTETSTAATTTETTTAATTTETSTAATTTETSTAATTTETSTAATTTETSTAAMTTETSTAATTTETSTAATTTETSTAATTTETSTAVTTTETSTAAMTTETSTAATTTETSTAATTTETSIAATTTETSTAATTTETSTAAMTTETSTAATTTTSTAATTTERSTVATTTVRILPDVYNYIQMLDVTSFTKEMAEIKCDVHNAIDWNSVTLRIEHGRYPIVVKLSSTKTVIWLNGKQRRFDVRYDVVDNEAGSGSNITIVLINKHVECSDNTSFVCELVSEISNASTSSNLVVVGKPSSQIDLLLGPSIIEGRALRLTATWQGGYPIPWTNMSWTAIDVHNQRYDLTKYGKFRDYKLQIDHRNCQTRLIHSIVIFPKMNLNATTFTVKPDLTKIQDFVTKKMETMLIQTVPGVEKILVIPLNYCQPKDTNTTIEHPYTKCGKFVRCLPGDLVIQQCPLGTCFSGNRHGCY